MFQHIIIWNTCINIRSRLFHISSSSRKIVFGRKLEPEFEILDTGVFDDDEYFDVLVTYAKQNSSDIFIKIDITNRYHKAADITVLPTLWFYNKWNEDHETKPDISLRNKNSVKASHHRLGDYYLYFQTPKDKWFTENETNLEKVIGQPNKTPWVKDAFHSALIKGENLDALKKRKNGTKFSPVYKIRLEGGKTESIYLRLRINQSQIHLPSDLKKSLKCERQKRMLFIKQSFIPTQLLN